MFIKAIKIKKVYFFLIILLILALITTTIYSISLNTFIWNKNYNSSYIKWIDFTPTYDVLDKTSKLDINSHNNNEEVQYNWIELLSFLACKNGGNFKNFKDSDLTNLIEKLKSGSSMIDLTKDLKNYSYYFESYDAILHDFIGNYEIQNPNLYTEKNTTDINNYQKTYSKKYGIKNFLPIAKNYNFNHYKDFGSSRSYGYKRVHLGNDLIGNIGTPIIAVESGFVECLGWNQYGGWRIGIRSFDKKRYYYYAHLRKDHPYTNLKEGQLIKAGDVIGYLGMTGYSSKENINNINIPHLHFGLQIIFNDAQKNGDNQIWVDVYNIVEFLRKNKSEVYQGKDNDFYRKYDFFENNNIQ